MNGRKLPLIIRVIDDLRGDEPRARLAERANRHAEDCGLRPGLDFPIFTKENLDDTLTAIRVPDAYVKIKILEEVVGLSKVPLSWLKNEEGIA